MDNWTAHLNLADLKKANWKLHSLYPARYRLGKGFFWGLRK